MVKEGSDKWNIRQITRAVESNWAIVAQTKFNIKFNLQ